MFEINIYESFCSIQGESSFAGTPCYFIRFAGCNLRCKYCDTQQAWTQGIPVPADQLISEAIGSGMPIIEITGGEPLMQDNFGEFAGLLRDESGKTVLVETNGSCDISVVPDDVIAIMDVKCPSSGEADSFNMQNISRLRYYDEVKFVISDENDYDWARNFVTKSELSGKCKAVHFSPVNGVMDAKDLADWILRDGLEVRLQVQLHKLLGIQ